MIRDPSDGSVREPRKPQVSGLPSPESPEKREERQRIEKSREWLKDYHARRSGQKLELGE